MRIGGVGYATAQGLGHLLYDFYNTGVIDEVLIFKHRSHRNTHMEWYPPGTPQVNKLPFKGGQVDKFLSEIDVLLCFETPFDWELLSVCKSRGIKTALVPMYEWTLQNPPHWFDKVISPSLLDQEYFPGSKFIPIPVRVDKWQQREKAKRFLHNAGNIGHREHKGTRQLLQAVKYVNSDFVLTVRAQDTGKFAAILDGVPEIANDSRVVISSGEISYEDLWNDQDVYIAPEKLNGLSLPLQEARAAGLLVMTTDRYPHNTWLPRWSLIPPATFIRTSIAPGYLEFDEAVVDPSEIAIKIDEVFEKDISEYSQSGLEWAKQNSWESLKPVWLEELNSW